MKRSYKARYGHERTRIATHPRRKARKERAYARGGSLPGTKPNPPHKKLKLAA
jgi:hypothetical protein